MSLATRPLQGKSELVEQSLALSDTERNGVMPFKMMRQQQTIPQVLVVSQLSGGTPYFASQPFLLQEGKPTGTTWAIPFTQSSKAIREKPVNPVIE